MLLLGEDGPRLTLQHVNILERDNSSRILQYESSDKQIIVTRKYGDFPIRLSISCCLECSRTHRSRPRSKQLTHAC